VKVPLITEEIAPLGPETSRLLDYCRERREALTRKLVKDVSDGIRVLVTRGDADLTELQIAERAANIVAGIIGNYEITDKGD
jgi:hypothetical protein